MAQHEANHSSTERTILWIIIPATIGVSLLFTNLNRKMKPDHEVKSSDIGLSHVDYDQHDHSKPAEHEGDTKGEHTPAADTSHAKTDTLHVKPQILNVEGTNQDAHQATPAHDAPKH